MSEKKYYVIGCTSTESWELLHSILTRDGTLDDNIPDRSVECTDLKEHSPTRAVYLLDDNEAEQLSQHPDIKFIHIEPSHYRDLFPSIPDELHNVNRYSSNVKNYRDFTGILPGTTDSTDLNRSGYQILRGTQQADPWIGVSASTVISSKVPNKTGTGVDIDVIVGDDGCWFGHVEFANNTGTGPDDYIGGNVLPGNGTCDLLDLVLDGPYYLDPTWFDASPSTLLTIRWDGTIVPTGPAARAWWGSTSQRSASFASFGTVSIPSYYTRGNCNGSDTVKSYEGQHGTACAGQAYGRTHGWAYNANKWFINAYGLTGLWPVDRYFDVMKIFHQAKPVNLSHGNKNPTISSNSWGYREIQGTSGYYYFRQGDSGSGGVAYASKPKFMEYLGSTGDGGRFKSELIDNNLTTAGDELIAAGVIFIAAAGNSNQKHVGSSHPDFNNYWASSADTPLTSAVHTSLDGVSICYNTTNRRGFPKHLGKYTSGSDIVYPVIMIGALDDGHRYDGKEQKVNYSDMGEQIDCYAPGDGTLSSSWLPYGSNISRYDQRGGSALTSYDTRFSGTSSACPTATGMIATALQYHRSWTWQDIRAWLKSLTEQSTTDFYQGPEPSTATDSQWSDLNSLMGGDRRVIYNTISVPAPLSTTLVVATMTVQINQTITPFTPVTASGGTLPYTFDISPSLPNGLNFNTLNGQITGTPTESQSASAFTVTVTDIYSSSSNTFTLTVQSLQEISTVTNIGTLVPGEISELSVISIFSTATTYPTYPKYTLTDGELPEGLSLYRDGTIGGQVAVNPYVYASTYIRNFTVSVSDSNNNNLLIDELSITVKQSNNNIYTNIYCNPFLIQSKRAEFTEFISNDGIFVPSMLYRPFDPNFGRQEGLQVVIDFGVEVLRLDEYAAITSTNFYKRQLSLGDIKTAVAKNAAGEVLYEFIYLDIVDKHVNANKISVPREITVNGITYYPPSIPNMRSNIFEVANRTSVRDPSFTNFVQLGDSIKLGYTSFVPLCYTLPGKSATIIRKIKESSFKFNTINFEIDRIIIQDSINQTGAKYLLLRRDSKLA